MYIIHVDVYKITQDLVTIHVHTQNKINGTLVHYTTYT